MSPALSIYPPTLGLFEKRIEGDDCLLQLAQLRFRQAGMGAEIYAVTPEQLEWALRFRPASDSPVVVHLNRKFNLAEDDSRRQIEVFAQRFAGRIDGLVIHDHRQLAENSRSYLAAAREMNSRLQPIKNCPRLFVEYAVGLELDVFAKFFESIRELDRISVCVDIGHVGIHEARKAYSQIHPRADICALKSQPEKIPPVMDDVEKSVLAALPAVLGLVKDLGAGGKPAHFHLHDGHPLSTYSPFGVADHLSFLAEIPLHFKHHDRRQTGTLFGRAGLFEIVARAIRVFGSESVSFTLEIQPTMERLPLGDAATLFQHWRDKTNAEKMNCWLAVLCENHRLLLDAIRAAPTIAHTNRHGDEERLTYENTPLER